MINLFFVFFNSNTGFPIFPPNKHFNLLFLRRCSNNLHVVDLPLVPVTTILLNLIFVK